MPIPRNAVALAALNGRIYAFGGQTLVDCAYTSAVQIYDPGSDSWTLGAPMPTQRTAAAAAAMGGNIHVMAGGVGCGPFTGVHEVYTPSSDSWRTFAPAPARYGPASVSTDGKVYLFGGFVSGQPLDRVDAFDPTSQTWTQKAPMPTARGHAAAVLLDGKAYLIGGCCFPGGTGVAVEAYDPPTNSWTRKRDLAFPVHSSAAAVLNGAIYLIGTGNDLRGVKRYDVASDTWADDAPMPDGLVLHGVAAVERTLYVIGGEIPGVITGTTYAFTPAANTAPTAVAGPDQRLECAAGSATAVLDGSASFDSDGGIASYNWSRQGNTFANTVTAVLTLPRGSYAIDLRVTDDAGLSDDAAMNVDVVDTRAPTVTIAPTSNPLWPATHAMVHVANVTARDSCDSHPTLAIHVTSSESADDRGDGATTADWDIRPAADGTMAVYLRAERSGRGDGRAYAVVAQSTDASGNSGSSRAVYEVRHSARK